MGKAHLVIKGHDPCASDSKQSENDEIFGQDPRVRQVLGSESITR